MSTRYLVELVPAGEEFMFYARQVERRAVERTPVINPSADAVAAWVVFAGDGTAAEAAVARHLYLLSQGEGPDPLVAQVHPVAAEPEPQVVDGLTVGVRYRLDGIDAFRKPATEALTFGGKNGDYYWFKDHRSRYLHENDAATGAVVVTDLDGNRVDYWAEQARAFIADARAHGTTNYELRRRPIWTAPDMPAYEPPTFHALPRVLDEQESTR